MFNKNIFFVGAVSFACGIGCAAVLFNSSEEINKEKENNQECFHMLVTVTHEINECKSSNQYLKYVNTQLMNNNFYNSDPK